MQMTSKETSARILDHLTSFEPGEEHGVARDSCQPGQCRQGKVPNAGTGRAARGRSRGSSIAGARGSRGRNLNPRAFSVDSQGNAGHVRIDERPRMGYTNALRCARGSTLRWTSSAGVLLAAHVQKVLDNRLDVFRGHRMKIGHFSSRPYAAGVGNKPAQKARIPILLA